MHNEDWVSLLRLIPESQQSQVMLALQNGGEISVDIIVRYEPTYVVLRGRVAGTTDEGRAFFVPYDQITYVRMERVVKLSELRVLYGEAAGVDAESPLEERQAAAAAAALAAGVPAPAPEPVTPQGPGEGPPSGILDPEDPAALAKNKLLERIRAARASIGAPKSGK